MNERAQGEFVPMIFGYLILSGFFGWFVWWAMQNQGYGAGVAAVTVFVGGIAALATMVITHRPPPTLAEP